MDSGSLESGRQNFRPCRPDGPIEIWQNFNVVWLLNYTFSGSRIDLSMQRLPLPRHWKALKRITYLSTSFRPALSLSSPIIPVYSVQMPTNYTCEQYMIIFIGEYIRLEASVILFRLATFWGYWSGGSVWNLEIIPTITYFYRFLNFNQKHFRSRPLGALHFFSYTNLRGDYRKKYRRRFVYHDGLFNLFIYLSL